MSCILCPNPALCNPVCRAFEFAPAAVRAQMREACAASGQMDSRQVSAHVEAGEMPTSCEWCTDPDGEACFPQYGVGPHTCFFHIPGATFGQSKPLPREEWPSNYREDPESPGMGVYWCPHCGSGKPVEAGEMPCPCSALGSRCEWPYRCEDLGRCVYAPKGEAGEMPAKEEKK